MSKRTKAKEPLHELLLLALILKHSNTWVSWKWKLFRRFRLQHKDLLKARGVHNELKECGFAFLNFSWQWYLCIDLRKHLNSQISDKLVARIIADYEIYERKRLHGEFAILGKPGSHQFMTTTNSLNSTYKELAFWAESGYNQLQEELKKRIEDCKSNLGTIARQSISGIWLDYKELEKHSFYYTANLTLLRHFEPHQEQHIQESKSSVLEINGESSNLSQFTPFEWATILLFVYESHLFSFSTWKECALSFIVRHEIPTTYDYFRKEYYKVRKSLYKRCDYPIEKLDTILPFVRNHYPEASKKIEGDKKFLLEEQSNNQEIREI